MAPVTMWIGRTGRPRPSSPVPAVQVEARDAEALRDRDRLRRGVQQLVDPIRIDQVAGHVAGHRREGGAGSL